MADEKNQTQGRYLSRGHIMYMSPSLKDGIDFQHEEKLRRRYVRFIRELGKTLRLPQHPTIASAAVLCHRFFLHHSHSLNDCLLIASACLFLAAKAEDTPCPLSHVVSASLRLRSHANSTPPASIATPSPASRLKLDKDTQLLLLAEFMVLSTISFDFTLDHPYKPLLTAIDKLKLNPQMEKELFMLGERNAKKELSGTHVPLSKFDRGDQFMAKDQAENAPCNSRNGQVLNNIAQHQSIYRSSIEHMGGQASASTSTILKRNAPSAVGMDCQNKWRRIEPTHAGRQDEEFTPPVDLQKAGEKAFLQVAWNFVNDSMLTSLGLQFKPHVIAAAAVWLAAKFLDVKLPYEGERIWWKELDVTPLQLEEAGNQILEVCMAVETDIKASKSVNFQVRATMNK